MEFPETYGKLMEGDHEGWQVEKVYYLELESYSGGIFPALLSGTRRVIVTLDLALASRVERSLPARRSGVRSANFLVNREAEIGYPMRQDGEPQKLFTWAEFAEVTAKNPWPFEWARELAETTREFCRIFEPLNPEERILSFAEAAAMPPRPEYPGARR